MPADFNDHAEEISEIEDIRSISPTSSHDSDNCPGYGFGQGAPVHSCGCYDFRSRLSKDSPKCPQIPMPDSPDSKKNGSDNPVDSQHESEQVCFAFHGFCDALRILFQQISKEWQARAEEIRDCLPPQPLKLKRKHTELNEGSVSDPHDSDIPPLTERLILFVG